MKKIVALLIVICLCISMVGCSAITTTHAAEDAKVAEEETKDLGDMLTEVAAGLFAAWLTSEIEDYINQQTNNEVSQTEVVKPIDAHPDNTIPLEK